MHELEKYYEPNEDLLNQIEKEVQSLKNSAMLQAYLESILNLDQKYRIEAQKLVATHGYDSEAHQNMWKKINQTDAENYFRVVAVLRKFGYPNIDSIGIEAARAPWLIIHHTPHYEHKAEHFNIIYKAYLDGNVDENAMGLFMDRMHHMAFGEMFHMPSPYRMNDKIDTLVQVLSLEEQMNL